MRYRFVTPIEFIYSTKKIAMSEEPAAKRVCVRDEPKKRHSEAVSDLLTLIKAVESGEMHHGAEKVQTAISKVADEMNADKESWVVEIFKMHKDGTKEGPLLYGIYPTWKATCEVMQTGTCEMDPTSADAFYVTDCRKISWSVTAEWISENFKRFFAVPYESPAQDYVTDLIESEE